MQCPHCEQNTFELKTFYFWPYGVRECTSCHGGVRAARNNMLLCISCLLGLTAGAVPFILDSFWYLLPAVGLALAIDYGVENKYRKLEAVNK